LRSSAHLLQRLRNTSVVDAWVYRFGPASRRIPRPVRRRAVAQAAIPRLDGVTYWSFGTAEIQHAPKPKTLGGALTLSPLARRQHRVPVPFVAELPDAALVGRHAIPFSRDGHMLLTGFRDALPLLALEAHPELDEWIAARAAWREPHPELVQALSATPVCPLVGRFDSNYFHWLIDICGQLEGLTTFARATGEEPAVLVRAGAPGFVRESLALLGFAPHRVLEWPLTWSWADEPRDEDMLVAHVPRLVISSWRGHRHGSSGRSLAWLRNVFLAGTSHFKSTLLRATPEARIPSSGLKVYVQRSPTGWRTIENEAQVRDVLERRGFLVMRPEQHPLREQVAMFSRASLIVGMHGAGLTNVLFAPSAHLVELAGDYGGPEYFSMCHGLGNPYTRVQSKDRGDDIYVDLGVLESALPAT
jgi:Glycosyltransferase 61